MAVKKVKLEIDGERYNFEVPEGKNLNKFIDENIIPLLVSPES